MATRSSERLTALVVKNLKGAGMYADGGGLYLQVGDGSARSWIFRYMLNGVRRDMGIGPLHSVSLAEARSNAADARKLVVKRIDPIEHRRAEQNAVKLEAARAVTFKKCAEDYIASQRAGWRNEKHARQWESTLQTYAYPLLGALPVQAIDVALVTKVLEPIWRKKTETASRLRGRIEAVLDYATAREYRRGDNPARWKGHLNKLLPTRASVQRVQHRKALPHAEIAEFMAELRTRGEISAHALEFLILTTTRTSEVLGARWEEINLSKGMWIIPPERHKTGKRTGKSLRIALSSCAVAILDQMKKIVSQSEFVFPGNKKGAALSNMALLQLRKRMGRSDIDPHGFRSSFRDWAAERTMFPRELAEMALGHEVGDDVEAAYLRSDLFERRRRLMDVWAEYCEGVETAAELVKVE